MPYVYSEPATMSNLKVSELPRALRPREKMMQSGPKALSNVELLAVILGAGTRKDDVLKLAGRAIRKHGTQALPHLSVREWNGVGRAQACRLVAAFELARRIEKESSGEPARISGPKEVYNQVRDICRLGDSATTCSSAMASPRATMIP